MSSDEQARPSVWWDPGWLSSARPLHEEGEIVGSPFSTLDAAFQAVDDRRAAADHSSPRDNVFLATYAPKGWVVFEYSEARLGRADLDEIDTRGLPLGGSVTEPRTYVVDGRGRLGRLVRDDPETPYRLEHVERDSLGTVTPPSTYVPAVVPRTLRNHGKNVQWTPKIALRPGTDVDELSSALRWIDENQPEDVNVKAGGWRHSWSAAPATDGVYIHPEHLRGVEAVSQSAELRSFLLDGSNAASLFRVLSGTRIRHINAFLWEWGRALPVLGGYDGQTLGGVLPTGTHGSVLASGPLAEVVRSLDLIRFDGTKVRIERASSPLTSPTAFAAARPDWQLVQRDDDFDAALISMGTMGVVHSFLIESVERFWLKEIRTAVTLGDTQEILRGGNIYHLLQTDPVPNWVAADDGRRFEGHPRPAYHEELLWNSYTDYTIVTSRHPVADALRREFEEAEPEGFDQPPSRSLFRVLKLDAMADEYSRPDLTELATEHFSGALDEIVEVIARIRPKLLPGFIDSGLKGMRDPSYIQRSYNVFNVGEGANNIPAQSGTISIPLRDDLWLSAIDTIRETATTIAHERNMYQTGPISLRFVRGSTFMLADPEDVCKFEIIFGGDNELVQRLSHEIIKAHYDALYTRFGGDVRLHWGQIVPDGTLDAPGRHGHRLRESYARYDEWRRLRDQYDPKARGLNAWQMRILPNRTDAP